MNIALDEVAEKKRLLDAKLDDFGKAMTTEPGRLAFAQLPALLQEQARTPPRSATRGQALQAA